MRFPELVPSGLGGYGELEQLALQPTVLALGPERARAQFVADLDRMHRTGAGLRVQADQRARELFRLSQQRTHPLQKIPLEHGQKPRYKPPSNDGTRNHTGYLVAAIQRDAALADYDRRTRAR